MVMGGERWSMREGRGSAPAPGSRHECHDAARRPAVGDRAEAGVGCASGRWCRWSTATSAPRYGDRHLSMVAHARPRGVADPTGAHGGSGLGRGRALRNRGVPGGESTPRVAQPADRGQAGHPAARALDLAASAGCRWWLPVRPLRPGAPRRLPSSSRCRERGRVRWLLLGATPTDADPAMGGSRPGAGCARAWGHPSGALRRFWEKPSPPDAEAFFTAGHLWNTFMFVTSSDLIEAGRSRRP